MKLLLTRADLRPEYATTPFLEVDFFHFKPVAQQCIVLGAYTLFQDGGAGRGSSLIRVPERYTIRTLHEYDHTAIPVACRHVETSYERPTPTPTHT